VSRDAHFAKPGKPVFPKQHQLLLDRCKLLVLSSTSSAFGYSSVSEMAKTAEYDDPAPVLDPVVEDPEKERYWEKMREEERRE
jgi:hypothetical protein